MLTLIDWIYIGGVGFSPVVMIIPPVLLLIQLWFCFSNKPLIIKLAPSAINLAVFLITLPIGLKGEDWSLIIWLVIAIYACFLLVCCGIGWAIYGITQLIKSSRK